MSRQDLVALVLFYALAITGCGRGDNARIAELEARVQWLEERAGLHDEEPYPTDIPIAAIKLRSGEAIRESDIVYRAMSVNEMYAQGWRPDEIIVSPKHIVGRTPKIDIPPGTPFLTNDLYVAGFEPNPEVFAALAKAAQSSAQRNRPSTIPKSSAAEESVIAYDQIRPLPGDVVRSSPTHDVIVIPRAGDSGFEDSGATFRSGDHVTTSWPEDDSLEPSAGWTNHAPSADALDASTPFNTYGGDYFDVTVMSDPELVVQAYEEAYEQAYWEVSEDLDAYDPWHTPFVLSDDEAPADEDEWDWSAPARVTNMHREPVTLPRDETFREIQVGQSMLPPGDPWATPLIEEEDPVEIRYPFFFPPVVSSPNDSASPQPEPPGDPGEYQFEENEVLP